MRRWTNVAPKRQSVAFKTAVPSVLSFGRIHPFVSICSIPEKKWLPVHSPRWQQSRSCAEQSSILSVSQQGSDSKLRVDLGSASLSNEHFLDLLSEGARYCIHDVKALDFESSVTSLKGQGTRLVDQAKYQFDFELWAILLHYRMRVYGDEGIKTIWKFLSPRYRIRSLPSHWPMEDSLWNVFVSLGLRDHEFLGRIRDHTKRLWRERKLRRPSLYVEVIGGLLKSENSAPAPIFSPTMHPGVVITSDELSELFLEASKSADPKAWENFWPICDSVPNHKIYNPVIPTLCEQGRIVEAMAMHSHLIRRHDCPATFEAVEPLVRHIAQNDLSMSAFLRPLEAAGVSFSGRVQKIYESVKTSSFGKICEEIDLATSRTFGVKRSKISDAFAARFFATKSFSFDFALSGLYMLGLQELGPLSLREIALKAGSGTLIRQRLEKLNDLRIDTGGSAYSRVIRKLAREQEDALLMDVVHCDQHPDVFEDQKVQLQLLNVYHHAKDWGQANRTLAILDIWGRSSWHAPNNMLRGALMRQDWPAATRIATQLHQDDAYITKANIILMYKCILRPRRSTTRVPVNRYGFHDLMYLITLWQNSLKSGTYIPPDVWREPLRRLGMMGKWTDLEKTCLWLCSFYAPPEAASAEDCFSANPTILPTNSLGGTRGHHSFLSEIFYPALQSAMVQWGFIAGLRPRKVRRRVEAFGLKKSTALREAPWVCGIELLCRLASHYEVCLHHAAIRTACEQRLRQLFSRGGRSRRKHNRLLRRNNRAKLRYYLDWINKVYGQIILDPCDARTLWSIYRRRCSKRKHLPRWIRSMRNPIARRRASVPSQWTVNLNGASVNGDDVVMYRDLFPSSWEDNQLRQHNNEN
jgi:hypothetical protein